MFALPRRPRGAPRAGDGLGGVEPHCLRLTTPSSVVSAPVGHGGASFVGGLAGARWGGREAGPVADGAWRRLLGHVACPLPVLHTRSALSWSRDAVVARFAVDAECHREYCCREQRDCTVNPDATASRPPGSTSFCAHGPASASTSAGRSTAVRGSDAVVRGAAQGVWIVEAARSPVRGAEINRNR
jgi:hypothetical protein